MAIHQAKDTYPAREHAVVIGMDKVIYAGTPADGGAEGRVPGQGRLGRPATWPGTSRSVRTRLGGDYGTLTHAEDLCQMQTQEYIRVGNGQDPCLTARTTRHVLSLCAQRLCWGTCIQMNQPPAGLLHVSSPGAPRVIDPEVGEVKGWRAWTMDGLRLAQHVLMEEVLGDAAGLDDELAIDNLNYWTT